MQKNPYSLLFGAEPTEVIPRSIQSAEIIESFNNEISPQMIYMITGVRGCRKTVFMTEIAKELRQDNSWIVIELNSSSDLMRDLVDKLGCEKSLVNIFDNASINLSFFGIGIEVKNTPRITNEELAITKMLETIRKHNKRVLVCIDEVSATKDMQVFASAFQILIRQKLPIYLLMTGLYENINDLQNKDNLTFLYRAPKVELDSLNLGVIANNYKNNFAITYKEAMDMAKITKGFPYAFQLLGYVSWKNNGDYKKALPIFKEHLEKYVYRKIWSGLSPKDKQFIYGIAKSSEGKAFDIKRIVDMSDNEYCVYRSRLIDRGVIDGSNYGSVSFTLPLFKEFVFGVYDYDK